MSQVRSQKKWSQKWRQLKITTWNCYSLSRERYDYCKKLHYDVLALTELHNLQNKIPDSKLWITSEVAEKFKSGPKQGKCSDPATGVAIMLSPRMSQHFKDAGNVGTRIAWVRLAGPVCNIFIVTVYIPHKYRTEPSAQDTLAQLDALLVTVNKKDWIIITGDFNCQLRRNEDKYTGQWSMTSKHEKNGHDQEVFDLMRQYDLFAVGTKFKPNERLWSGKLRRYNATYLPKHVDRRPTKLDYCLVANRWKSCVEDCRVKWGTSLHRFGKKFDHGLLSTTWTWRIRTVKTSPPWLWCNEYRTVGRLRQRTTATFDERGKYGHRSLGTIYGQPLSTTIVWIPARHPINRAQKAESKVRWEGSLDQN